MDTTATSPVCTSRGKPGLPGALRRAAGLQALPTAGFWSPLSRCWGPDGRCRDPNTVRSRRFAPLLPVRLTQRSLGRTEIRVFEKHVSVSDYIVFRDDYPSVRSNGQLS